MSRDDMTAFGLLGSHVNYVIDKLELRGRCEYVAGVLYAPAEYHDKIYELVKDYKKLKANVADWENTEKKIS